MIVLTAILFALIILFGGGWVLGVIALTLYESVTDGRENDLLESDNVDRFEEHRKL